MKLIPFPIALPLPTRRMSIPLILVWGLLLVSTPVLPAESPGAGAWQHGVAVGARASYAPAKLPATVLDYNFSKPFAARRYLYHRVNIGLWHRQEDRTPPDVIVVPTGRSLPYYTTAYAAYGIGIRSPGQVYFYFNHGIGLISETTPYLGSHGQFLTALGFGYRGSKRTVECGVQHLSNGSRYFGSPQPNLGEDFFLCSLTIRR